MVLPHLLYPDVPLFNPRIKIHLFRGDEYAGTFGAASLTREKAEIGVLHQACEHAGVSSVEKDVLKHYRARVEGPGFMFTLTYDADDLEFHFTS